MECNLQHFTDVDDTERKRPLLHVYHDEQLQLHNIF